MIIVSKPEDWPLEYYPEVTEKTEDVISHYAIFVEYDGGYILFHTITWSIFYLTAEEYANIMDNEEMRRIHVVLDKSIDEVEIATKVYCLRSQCKDKISFDHLASYVIFTTTACNARCAYCYEKGIKKVTMTEETAENVVKYIEKTLGMPNINLRWFGGEPLLNTKVIDYICKRLNDDGIIFNSDIITNGYLLNEENVAKFEKWNVKSIQVTIDAAGEDYKRIKNYVNNDPNPFETVVGNVKRIIDETNVGISIRINVSEDNIKVLPTLLDELQGRFINGSKRIPHIYALPVNEISCNPNGISPQWLLDELDELYEKYPFVSQLKKGERNVLRKAPLIHCSANFGTAVSINADGKISPCEHWSDSEVIGDIVNGVTNNELAEAWGNMGGENIKFCNEQKCSMLPICKHFYRCPLKKTCTNTEKLKRVYEWIEIRIKSTFEFYLKKKKEYEENNK